MQKKTKSLLVDVIVILVCLAGSALSIWRFWQELNKTFVKLNEEPIATITFKYNTAQRKFVDDNLWDRLRQNSPVYDGDTIRTSDFSEATIYFNDGNIMDLGENTMARVNLSKGNAEIDFTTGHISVQTSDSGLTIKSGSSVVELADGASVSASSVAVASTSATSEGASAVSSSGASADSSAGTATAENVFRVQVQAGTASVSSGENKEAVALEAGTVADVKVGEEIVKKTLSVLSPEPDEKILCFGDTKAVVPFNWNADDADVKIEFAENKTFSKIKETYDFSGVNQTEMILGTGTHYWRMFSGDETLTGKITIYSSLAPKAIAPVNDYVANYRTVKPSIRFIWSESERATAYEFEIADNPDMKNPVVSQRTSQTSGIITSLEEGDWYWQVTPYYSMNNIGLAQPSEVYSFSIVKSDALKAPELLSPRTGSIVNTKVPVDGKMEPQSVTFSWKEDVEAASYTVRITPEGNGAGSSIVEKVTSNYFTMDPNKYSMNNGSWSWSVEIADMEGNTVTSAKNTFTAMDSAVSQKTLFPPENYQVADFRMSDMRFTWKTNLYSDMEMQISMDPSFSVLVDSMETKNTSASGFTLQPGKYYWRVITKTDETTVASNVSSFVVETPLQAPACASPVNGERVILSEGEKVSVVWKAVSGSDYYQMRFYSDENLSELLYEEEYIESDGRETYEIELPMTDFNEQRYYWTVQAFRDESDMKSRSVSYLGKYSFQLRKLKPITLGYPAEDEVIEGLDVIYDTPSFEWNSIDPLADSELKVYKGSIDEKNVVASVVDPEQKMTMPRLYEGTYFWTVRGMTLDDIDVSSPQTRKFVISSIPNMTAPVQVSPVKGEVFDNEYFELTDNVVFSWKPVQYATEYAFKLKDSNGNILDETLVSDFRTSCTVPFDKLTKEGTYTWTVEARTVFEPGVIRYGDEAEETFRIQYNRLASPVKNTVGKNDVLDEAVFLTDEKIDFSWNPVPYADEYVFRLYDSMGILIHEELFRGQKASLSVQNLQAATEFTFKNIFLLKPGRYIWTVEARDYYKGVLLSEGEVEESEFLIEVNNLPSPGTLSPASEESFSNELFVRDQGLAFSWNAVPGAEDYVFRFYDAESELIDEQVVTDTGLKFMNLEALSAGRYSWTVEARNYFNGQLLQHGDMTSSYFSIVLPDLKAPVKVAPVENYELDAAFFRKDEPLSFSWKGVAYADEYIFTLKSSSGEELYSASVMEPDSEKTVSCSVPAEVLWNEDEYFWTVEARSHYHGRLLQNGIVDDTGLMKHISLLAAPEKVGPSDGYLLMAPFFKDGETLDFSWKTVPGADEYVFQLMDAEGETLRNVQLVPAAGSDVVSYDISSDELSINGEYSWFVEALSYYHGQSMQNGYTELSSFSASIGDMDAPVITGPSMGQELSTPFFMSGENLEFSWNPVPYADEYIFRLYDTDGDLLLEEALQQESTEVDSGLLIISGEYSWTVEARNYYNGEVLQKGAPAEGAFSVNLSLLDVPVAETPLDGDNFGADLFIENKTIRFAWSSVPYADEYIFRLYTQNNILLHEEHLRGSNASLSVRRQDAPCEFTFKNTSLLSKGNYYWTVEARNYYRGEMLQYGLPLTTRFGIGYEYLEPPVIDEAFMNRTFGASIFEEDAPVSFIWQPVATADQYTFTLTDPSGKVIVQEVVETNETSVLPEKLLKQGSYSWTVKASNIYNGEILQDGKLAEANFNVQIETLEAPAVIAPDASVVLGTGLFKDLGSMKFSWNSVQYADTYIFRLKSPDGKIIAEENLDGTDYVVQASDLRMTGRYTWSVQGVNHYREKVLQTGIVEENDFTVDLPLLAGPVTVRPDSDCKRYIDYFKTEATEWFSFQAVPYADEYVFLMKDQKGKTVYTVTVPAFDEDGNRLELLDVPVATELFSAEGVYTWSVEARCLYEGSILQAGEILNNKIQVAFPSLVIKDELLPQNGTEYGLELFKKMDSIDLCWKSVEDADRYVLTMKDVHGNEFEEILDNSTVGEDGFMHYAVSNEQLFDAGTYVWSVEPQLLYKGNVIKKAGPYENSFTVHKPAFGPVEIISGADVKLDKDSILENYVITVRWLETEYADDYKLRIFNQYGATEDVWQLSLDDVSEPGRGYLECELPVSLFYGEGIYRWDITAESYFDGRPLTYGKVAESTVVTTLPSIADVELVTPDGGKVFDIPYFRNNRNIRFSWTAVDDVTGYMFCIRDDSGNIISDCWTDADVTEIIYNDLTNLSAGDFHWYVTPIIAKGEDVLKYGKTVSGDFTIDLPVLKAPTVNDTGRLYGN